MVLKRLILVLVVFLLNANLMAQDLKVYDVEMEKVQLSFLINKEGSPEYSVKFGGKEIIKPSIMGFVFSKLNSPGFSFSSDDDFSSGFEMTNSTMKEVDETWKPVWGEESEIRDHYKQVIFNLKQTKTKRFLTINFKVFADGVAFRYAFPEQANIDHFIVGEEKTHFNLAGDHKTFWIPGDYDTNEYLYTTSKISAIDNKEIVNNSSAIAVRYAPDPKAVQTPLMMKTAEGLYINIHEAALINYPAMQLHVDNNLLQLSASLVPDAFGNKAYLQAPFNTPWRTIIVCDNAAGILNSRMILNLNQPTEIKNTDWIKPTKYIGVWWEMQTGKGPWSYALNNKQKDAGGNLIPNGTHSANTANVKRYIDFASANGIPAVLVEGWNVGWEDWFGNWKENVFDFVKPYPDFDVIGLQQYAKQKGVEIIMHHETSGSASSYERQMDTAYRFMKKYGYNSVKTGYVGRIIPRGEHHDGQWMVNHYLRVAKKTADYQIMVDMHEPVRPTGLQRTYPNFLASEAARGNEYNAFSDGNPPEHETILPFTRLMGGPMDYTPGIFKLKGYNKDVPGRQVHTTLAKQLALYVTIYSPLQMAADLPENYEAHMDAFQFIKDVPVDWDQTKIIEAEPGDYLTIARKQKGKSDWFIGAITDENSRLTSIPLTFLKQDAKYIATIYQDATDADWQKNPEAYVIKKVEVNSKTILKIPLAKGGGAAISIVLQNQKQ